MSTTTETALPADLAALTTLYGLIVQPAPDEAGEAAWYVYWPDEADEVGSTVEALDADGAREWLKGIGEETVELHAPQSLAVRAKHAGYWIIGAGDDGRLQVDYDPPDGSIGTQEALTPTELAARLAGGTLDDETPPAEAPLTTVAGLDALRPAPPVAEGVTLVDLALLDDNPYQPRQVYDAERIATIAGSIKQHGLLQTPIARRVGDRYQLAFGHSRLRAYRLLAETDRARYGAMPVILRSLDEEGMALQAWIENRDRKDLTPYEEAAAIQRNMEAFNWSQKVAGEKLQLDRSTISNKLRLLKLPAAALEQLRDGRLTERQAAALLPLAELPAAILGMSRDQLGKLIGGWVPTSAAEILAAAPMTDSSRLRQDVEDLIKRLTIALQGEPWAKQDVGLTPPHVHAANCADCPLRLKAPNRCPDRTCAGRKRDAYARSQAAAAAASVGLPAKALPERRGYQDTYDGLQGVGRQAIKDEAKRRECGNLGVVYSPDRQYSFGQKLDKHPDCYIACVHGEGRRCGCRMALARDTSKPQNSEEARKRADRKRIKAELVGPAETAVRQALAKPDARLWRLLLEKVHGATAQKLPEDADAAQILEALAARLVYDVVQYNLEYHPNYGEALVSLQKLLGRLGADLPWGDVRAQTSPDQQSEVGGA